VECSVPLDEPDQGFGTHTLALPSENAVVGYMAETQLSDALLNNLRHRFQDLKHAGIEVALRFDTVDDQQWAEAWKQHFHVVRITARIVVKPTWKPFEPDPDDIVIHLDPGMAFGTGTHPSTCMCIRQIEKNLVPGQRFLDVGCGSGILMIAAAKLGAATLTGIDTDQTAVDITRENLEKNHIPQERCFLFTGTLDQAPSVRYDLIAANIIAQTIAAIMKDIKKCMAPHARAILSGIIQERLPEVTDALFCHGLEIMHQDASDEWVTLTVLHKK
jgi:ribosomal protein L11 methyltransferase